MLVNTGARRDPMGFTHTLVGTFFTYFRFFPPKCRSFQLPIGKKRKYVKNVPDTASVAPPLRRLG